MTGTRSTSNCRKCKESFAGLWCIRSILDPSICSGCFQKEQMKLADFGSIAPKEGKP